MPKHKAQKVAISEISLSARAPSHPAVSSDWEIKIAHLMGNRPRQAQQNLGCTKAIFNLLTETLVVFLRLHRLTSFTVTVSVFYPPEQELILALILSEDNPCLLISTPRGVRINIQN